MRFGSLIITPDETPPPDPLDFPARIRHSRRQAAIMHPVGRG
jgi:hypothetical protein